MWVLQNVNISFWTQDMFLDIKQVRGKIIFFTVLSFYKKIGPKTRQNGCFFYILGFKTDFYVFSHVTRWVRPDFTFFLENVEFAIFSRFYSQKYQKMGPKTYNSCILKTRFVYILLPWKCYKPENWLKWGPMRDK